MPEARPAKDAVVVGLDLHETVIPRHGGETVARRDECRNPGSQECRPAGQLRCIGDIGRIGQHDSADTALLQLFDDTAVIVQNFAFGPPLRIDADNEAAIERLGRAAACQLVIEGTIGPYKPLRERSVDQQ